MCVEIVQEAVMNTSNSLKIHYSYVWGQTVLLLAVMYYITGTYTAVGTIYQEHCEYLYMLALDI